MRTDFLMKITKIIFVVWFFFEFSWTYQFMRTFTFNANSVTSSLDFLLVFDTFQLIQEKKMRNDCGDVDFTNTVYGGHFYQYSLESGCNETETQIWIRISDPKLGKNNFTMLYGNPNTISLNKETARAIFQMFNQSFCPSGFQKYTLVKGKFPMVAGESDWGSSGGYSSHTHPYNDDSGSYSGSTYGIETNTGTIIDDTSHIHVLDMDTSEFTSIPDHVNLLFCYMDSGEYIKETGSIVMINDIFSNIFPSEIYDFFDTDGMLIRGSDVDIGRKIYSNSHAGHYFSEGVTTSSGDHQTSYDDSNPVYIDICMVNERVWHNHKLPTDVAVDKVGYPDDPPYFQAILGSLKSTKFHDKILNENELFFSINPPDIGFEKVLDYEGLFLKGGSSWTTGGSIVNHVHSVSIDTESADVSPANCDELSSPPFSTISNAHQHHFGGFTGNSSVDNIPPFLKLPMFKKKDSDPIIFHGTEEMTPKICFGEYSTHKDVCNKQGECVGFNDCRCEEEKRFYGLECSEIIGSVGIVNHQRTILTVKYDLPEKYFIYLESNLTIDCTKVLDISKLHYECGLEIKNGKAENFKIISVVEGEIIEISSGTVIMLKSITSPSSIADVTVYVAGNYAWVGPVIAVVIIVPCVVFCILLIIAVVVGVIFFLYKRKSNSWKNDLEVMEEIEPKTKAILELKTDLFEIKYSDLKLNKKIGSGGSGCIIVKAEMKNILVAVKFFNISMSGDVFFDEFEKEVKILGSLSHPHILQFYGVVLKEGKIGIVMEYSDKGDVKSFLENFKQKEKKDYPFSGRLKLIYQSALGFQYLHSKGIIHRDVKAQNILISKHIEAKIIDFGFSKLVETSTEKSGDYMTSRVGAPEIVESNKYDTKVDVFSFGILMWILITLDWFPYGKKVFNIEMKVCKDENFRPKIENDQFNCMKWLIELVRKCWSEDPEQRPTFEEIVSRMKENMAI